MFFFFSRNIHYRARLKGPPFQFFRHCVTFLKNFFPKGFLFKFLMFCYRMDVEKSQRVFPFSFFGIVRLFFQIFFIWISANSLIVWHFEVLSLFLSLRYGADLDRSRLVFYIFDSKTKHSERSWLVSLLTLNGPWYDFVPIRFCELLNAPVVRMVKKTLE